MPFYACAKVCRHTRLVHVWSERWRYLGFDDLSTLQMMSLSGLKTRTGWPRGTADCLTGPSTTCLEAVILRVDRYSSHEKTVSVFSGR